jgi:hypothetical protein
LKSYKNSFWIKILLTQNGEVSRLKRKMARGR